MIFAVNPSQSAASAETLEVPADREPTNEESQEVLVSG